MSNFFSKLQTEIASVKTYSQVGRITELSQGIIYVCGLTRNVALGDRVLIHGNDAPIGGEIVYLSRDFVKILPDGAPDGIAIDCMVEHVGPAFIAPDNSWIGRIIDPYGAPLDGMGLLQGDRPRPLRAQAPAAAQRQRLGERLATGMAVFDTLLPLVRGQRMGLFAGSGVGKSSLLAKFARGITADIVVIALIGERGRELREFSEHILGAEGMTRAIIVAATSDESPLTRRRCAWTAMSIAEHFRDQGLHVLLLADSITRFAEAHREVAIAAGEAGNLRGFPASTSYMIMSLAERAGPGPEGAGDITAVFSVLVAGSDMDEPIADILRGVLDGHIVLERQIAERGRYPAINLLRSVSRSLPGAASDDENKLITDARFLLGTYDRAEMMIQAGLYIKGSDPNIDRAMTLWPALDMFLSEDAPNGVEESFERLAECLGLGNLGQGAGGG